MHDYRKLRVWRAATDLAVDTYTATSRFPLTERFGFTSQMRRSAVSIAANLAEGAGRASTADFRRFVHVAAGSAFEYETHVIVAERVGLFAKEDASELLEQVGAVKRMLHGLSARLHGDAD